MNTEHYFDWAATSPIDEEILKEAVQVSLDFPANPSSVHAEGIKAKEKLTEARERAAKALGVKKETLYFTSGGTESDYLPILSLLQGPSRGHILFSSIEHSAVAKQVEMMKNCGFSVSSIGCDSRGIITPEAVIQKIQNDTTLICIMAVNNETGAIQPIEKIAQAIEKHCEGKKKPRLHIDAVQAIGKIPFSIGLKGIDSVAISAHKIRGPRGCGLLYMKKRLEPFIRGGGQENGIRSGTENLLGAWALSRCLEKYSKPSIEEQKNLIFEFMHDIASIKGALIIPKNRIIDRDLYSPWILQASFSHIPGQVMVRALSEKGFYISTGSACSNRKNSKPVLNAMGINGDIAQNTVRFSFGEHTKKENLKALYSALKEIADLFS